MSAPYYLASDGIVRQAKILKTGVFLYNHRAVVCADMYITDNQTLLFSGYGHVTSKDDVPNWETERLEAEVASDYLAKGIPASWIGPDGQPKTPEGTLRFYVLYEFDLPAPAWKPKSRRRKS